MQQVDLPQSLRLDPAPQRAQSTQALVCFEGPEQQELIGLEREHEKLLVKISKKRSQLAEVSQTLRQLEMALFARIGPVRQRLLQLTRELRDLFAAVFERNLKVKERLELHLIYQTLMDDLPLEAVEFEDACAEREEGSGRAGADPTGAVEDLFDFGEEDFDEEDFDEENFDEEDPFSDGNSFFDDAFSGHEAAGGSADNEQAAAIRQLFRKLAMRCHPDRVQGEAEKAKRTQLMKQITQAYQEGDLALLLELERDLGQAQRLAGYSRAKRRVLELRTANEALGAQFRELTRELKYVRRESPFSLDLRSKDPSLRAHAELDVLVEEAETDQRSVERLRDFVLKFSSGKMSFAAFKRGPDAPRAPTRRKARAANSTRR